MVISLVEEERRRADHRLLTFGVRRPEKAGVSHQNEPGRGGAGQHHARTPQNIGLKDFPISAQHNKPNKITKQNPVTILIFVNKNS